MISTMNRIQKAAILTRLVSALRERGSWCGETHIQKAVFFLQELTNVPFGFRFVLYEYGPFSFDLRGELTGLQADYFLDLEVFEAYGPKFFATRRGDKLQARFPNTLRRFGPQIDFVASKLGNAHVGKLERLSTAFFITINNPQLESVEGRAEELRRIKSHVSEELAVDAVNLSDIISKEWHSR